MKTEYLKRFESKVEESLLQICKSANMADDSLLTNEDIDNRWQNIAPEYMVDAVPQVQQYPTVSVCWAAFLGMAIAWEWDKDWNRYQSQPYQSYYGKQGFDDMDEHIVYNLLGLEPDSPEARKLEQTIRVCGETAVNLIRREQIEPQSVMAFHVFARTCRSMFRIGASLQLKQMGYKFEKLN